MQVKHKVLGDQKSQFKCEAYNQIHLKAITFLLQGFQLLCGIAKYPCHSSNIQIRIDWKNLKETYGQVCQQKCNIVYIKNKLTPFNGILSQEAFDKCNNQK